MKRLTLLCLVALLGCLTPQLHAQKYACINTDYVLRNVPDYVQAKQKLDKYVEEWQKDLESKQQEVDRLRASYQQESFLLPESLKQRRQDEIKAKDTELREQQRRYFSAGGELDQKREALIKPIQNRIYNAIERIAREKNYAFVFDRAASSSIIYAGDKYDISNQVLEMMGYKPGAAGSNETSASPKSDSKTEPKPKPTQSLGRDDMGRDTFGKDSMGKKTR